MRGFRPRALAARHSSRIGFPPWKDWSKFWELTVSGLTRGSIYALIALGYSMVYGILKLLNFAHGDVYMIGAFVGWYVLDMDRAARTTPGSAAGSWSAA